MPLSIADELQNILRDVTPKLASISESSGASKLSSTRWSKKEILGHLIDSASNNHQRFVRSQITNSLRLEGYEQEHWVTLQGYQNDSWADLVSFWRSYNLHLARVMSIVPKEKLSNTIQIGQNDPVTLEFLMKDYLRHLKHHLEQILGE